MKSFCFVFCLLRVFGLPFTSLKAQKVNSDSIVIEYHDSLYYRNTFSLEDDSFKLGQVYRVTPAILFEYNESEVTQSSMSVLDSLAIFLKGHPWLSVEVGRHTDGSRGDEWSTYFTRKRAQKIVEELVRLGVDSTQLTYSGYEDLEEIVPMHSIKYMKDKNYIQLAHQRNRRTELKVVGIDKLNAFLVEPVHIGYDSLRLVSCLVNTYGSDISKIDTCISWDFPDSAAQDLLAKMEKVNSTEWYATCYQFPCYYTGKVSNGKSKYDISIHSGSYVILNNEKETLHFILREESPIFLGPCDCCE